MFLLDRAALADTRLQMISVGPSGPAFNDSGRCSDRFWNHYFVLDCFAVVSIVGFAVCSFGM